VVLAVVLAAAGCGSSSTSSTSSGASTTSRVKLAKTKFALHAGLGFGAFHHYIWAPLRAGELTHPRAHPFALVDAALAAGFVRHELRLAQADAQSSPTLSKLISPVTALEARFAGVQGSLHSGQANSSALTQANSSIGSIEQQSSASGQPITEQVPSHP
jgi:hypothetical protein